MSAIDAVKLERLRAITNARSAVVSLVDDVDVVIYPARISQSAMTIKLLSEMEESFVGLLGVLFNDKLDEDDKVRHIASSVVTLVLHTNIEGLLAVVQQSCDVPLDEPGIPPAAVALVVAKWVMMTFDPGINGPFVKQIVKSLPGGLADLLNNYQENLTEKSSSDTPDQSTPTLTISGEQSESSPPLEMPLG